MIYFLLNNFPLLRNPSQNQFNFFFLYQSHFYFLSPSPSSVPSAPAPTLLLLLSLFLLLLLFLLLNHLHLHLHLHIYIPPFPSYLSQSLLLPSFSLHLPLSFPHFTSSLTRNEDGQSSADRITLRDCDKDARTWRAGGQEDTTSGHRTAISTVIIVIINILLLFQLIKSLMLLPLLFLFSVSVRLRCRCCYIITIMFMAVLLWYIKNLQT